MKKTIAAGGASLLGISAVALVSTPAQAADVVDLCLTSADHIAGVGGDNWYMDCVPQYGLGRVGFDILSETGFPAGFAKLDDSSAVSSSSANTGPAASAYFGVVPPPAGFTELTYIDSFTTDRQYYNGRVIVPVASVNAIAPTELPDACDGGTYSNSYIVTYTPATVVFTQVVDGVEWRYDVVVAPDPLYLGLSLVGGVFDPLGSMCAVGGGEFGSGFPLFGVNEAFPSDEWDLVIGLATTGDDDGATVTPYFGTGKGLPQLADTSRYVAPRQLPVMGLDPVVPVGIAGLFLALGVAGGYLKRRRVHS